MWWTLLLPVPDSTQTSLTTGPHQKQHYPYRWEGPHTAIIPHVEAIPPPRKRSMHQGQVTPTLGTVVPMATSAPCWFPPRGKAGGGGGGRGADQAIRAV